MATRLGHGGRARGDLIQDLEIAFGCLRANKIKLNPEKCIFGIPRGMLLVDESWSAVYLGVYPR